MEDYLVVLERSETGFAAFSPDVPGCIATGRNAEETVREMRDALAFHLKGMLENGEALPEPKGLAFHLGEREPVVESGDWVTTIPRRDVMPAIAGAIGR